MQRRRRILWLAALLLATLAMPATARVWRVDRSASSITFAATCQGRPCTGSFGRFVADIAYDPAVPAGARFDIRVDVGSLAMPDPAHTAAVLGPALLDAARFPRAYLATTRFLRAAGGRTTAAAELKLHGAIRPVALTVHFQPIGAGAATLDVATRLRLRDFGIGGGASDSASGDDVEVRAHLVLHAAR